MRCHEDAQELFRGVRARLVHLLALVTAQVLVSYLFQSNFSYTSVTCFAPTTTYSRSSLLRYMSVAFFFSFTCQLHVSHMFCAFFSLFFLWSFVAKRLVWKDDSFLGDLSIFTYPQRHFFFCLFWLRASRFPLARVCCLPGLLEQRLHFSYVSVTCFARNISSVSCQLPYTHTQLDTHTHTHTHTHN